MDVYTKEALDEKSFIPSSLDDYIKWESQAKREVNAVIADIHIKNRHSININKLDSLDFKKISTEIAKLVLQIQIGSKWFVTNLDAQILHQLGSRIWRKIKNTNDKEQKSFCIDFYSDKYNNGEELELNEIYLLFKRLVVNEEFETIFFRYIKDVFLKFNLVILYFPNEKDNIPNNIYGIVSSSYKPLNQEIFRNTFLEKCQTTELNLDFNSSIQFKHKYINSIYEFIKTNHTFLNENIECSLVIEYGKNNGYRSYRFHWHITIKNTDDSLCIIKSKYNWRNNPQYIAKGFNYNLFIHNIVTEGRLILDGIDIQINKLKNNSLNDENKKVELFLDKIKVASATKERIHDSWNENYDSSNLWNFVKCLIHYSNNSQSYISFNMQNLIRKSAIDILDSGFEVLKKWGQEGSRYISKY